MDETQDANVTTETQRRKVEIQESHFDSETDITHKTILERIDFGKRAFTGVEDRSMMVRDEAPNVRFKLQDHAPEIIVRPTPEKSFDFRTNLITDPINSWLPREFNVNHAS